MEGIVKWIAVCLFLIGCGQMKKGEVKSLPQKLDSLVATIPDFSGVILLAEKGTAVYHKALGFAEIESNQKMDTTSVFELASVSKQFTAMLIAMLNEEKKLRYDDAIEKYLPGLPYPNITIRNLLNHTSGLPDYQKLMDEQWDKTNVATNDDIIAYLKKFHPAPLFKPGEKYMYSNTGYVLLGSIVEKASGEEFIAFCNKRIFHPLAMTSTDIRNKSQKEAIKNFAQGYILVLERRKYVRADSFPSSNYTIWLGGRKGPGRISSTASDLLKWDRALYSEKLVTSKTLNEIFSPAKLNNDSISNYGFGWMLQKDSLLGNVVYHTGDNPGYRTEIIRYIDKDKTLIVLCNNAHAKFRDLVKAIEQLIKRK
jgi:CubicO group peptidase (beta-lactamase class C family)